MAHTSGRARFHDGPTDGPALSLAAMKILATPPPIGATEWATIQILQNAACEFRLEPLGFGELALQRRGLTAPTGDAGDERAQLEGINKRNAEFWQRPARPGR